MDNPSNTMCAMLDGADVTDEHTYEIIIIRAIIDAKICFCVREHD